MTGETREVDRDEATAVIPEDVIINLRHPKRVTACRKPCGPTCRLVSWSSWCEGHGWCL